ncbi:MAG: stage II sporulation protein M [Streptococcaceae bacterium]|nr:stage II sporulation protein M [Streptococcaceae bacterium]
MRRFKKEKQQKYKSIWKIILDTFRLSKIEKILFLGTFAIAILLAWLLQKQFCRTLIKGVGHKSFFELLSHNFFIQLSIILGGFTFGTLSFVLLFINVFMIFAIVFTLLKVISVWKVLIIVPHGMFELLAFIISFKIMMSIIIFIIKNIEGKKEKFDFLSLLLRLSLIIFLLIVAAFIETKISYQILLISS